MAFLQRSGHGRIDRRSWEGQELAERQIHVAFLPLLARCLSPILPLLPSSPPVSVALDTHELRLPSHLGSAGFLSAFETEREKKRAMFVSRYV